jgi:hypothetical protein
MVDLLNIQDGVKQDSSVMRYITMIDLILVTLKAGSLTSKSDLSGVYTGENRAKLGLF